MCNYVIMQLSNNIKNIIIYINNYLYILQIPKLPGESTGFVLF